MTALWVEITATRGSAPRDAGTAMKVTAETTEGTIGGGALELAAIATARRLLAQGCVSFRQTLPLGPALGQCCGGSVSLLFTDAPRPVDPPLSLPAERGAEPQRAPLDLWIWGAGHVGRAIVASLPPGAARVTWVDSAPERFPQAIPPRVTVVPTPAMPLLAARAPREAHHLILTYSHEIDLALCTALLRRGFDFCGLIGSQTKWARFQRRLRSAGLDPSRITCPIGDKSLGKAPHEIAKGVVAALVSHPEHEATA